MNFRSFSAAACELRINVVSNRMHPATIRLWLANAFVVGLLATPAMAGSADSTADDKRIVAALDVEYQKAVKQNDAKTMSKILADDFVVIEGNGKRWTKADLLSDATSGKTRYEHQEDTDRTVRIWGDTAVVTAKLWAKGIEDGGPVDYVEWFSDTYVRTPSGWRYVFGQASLPLPKSPQR